MYETEGAALLLLLVISGVAGTLAAGEDKKIGVGIFVFCLAFGIPAFFIASS